MVSGISELLGLMKEEASAGCKPAMSVLSGRETCMADTVLVRYSALLVLKKYSAFPPGTAPRGLLAAGGL
jgi:hypothetical protein